MEMDARKKKVLLAIIHDYISTAEPVGSRTVSRNYDLGVSPATIRNEMADLEESGFIEQPHTSAGRVPSDLGYRYYVDYLMPRKALTMKQEEMIWRNYQDKQLEIHEIINCTSQLLASLTDYAAMIIAPAVTLVATVKHIQLVLMNPTRVMIIIVLDTGILQHHLVELTEVIRQSDLEQISMVLNNKLAGLNFDDIRVTVIKEIRLELSRYKFFLDLVLEMIQNTLTTSTPSKIHLGGVYNILNQPEFHNIERVKALLTLLEQKELLYEMLADRGDEDLSVCIGVENIQEQMKDCTMVTATYYTGDKMVGAIGVLGPTRMEYAKVITIVEYLAKILNQTLEKIQRK